jgi:hypothetical protein
MSDTQLYSKKLLPGPRVDERYGICARTRGRWKNNPKLNFPKPAAIINGREYYDEDELVVFERAQSSGHVVAGR